MAQHGRGVVTLLTVLCVCREIGAAGLGARGVAVLLGDEDELADVVFFDFAQYT